MFLIFLVLSADVARTASACPMDAAVAGSPLFANLDNYQILKNVQTDLQKQQKFELLSFSYKKLK